MNNDDNWIQETAKKLTGGKILATCYTNTNEIPSKRVTVAMAK